MILSVVPAIVILQIISQRLAGPILAVERTQFGLAATLVERAVSAIATVKAFNAVSHEHSAFLTVIQKLQTSAWRVNRIWAFTSGFNQFVAYGMFVQGFWFGAKLVREGSVEPGNVMGVFWACLIATTNFQMCIPHLITLAKGKFAMGSLIALVEAPSPSPSHGPMTRRPSVARSLLHMHKSGSMRRIVPAKCAGELELHEVTFAYPSRPSFPVLRDVTIYIAASETTFIVGGSGSGKSTVAQLLLRMYDVQRGTISLDDQDVVANGGRRMRREGRLLKLARQHFFTASSRICQMGTIRNLEMVVRIFPEGSGNGWPLPARFFEILLSLFLVSCCMSFDKSFAYVFADEATSALDATSRILVFEAIKRWRRNKTTIVITHDLSQISPNDFAYVLKEGSVVERGYRADLEVAGGEFQQMAMTQAEAGGFAVKEENTRAWRSSPSLLVTGCSTSSRILLAVMQQSHQTPQSLSGIRDRAASYPWKRSPAIAPFHHANAALLPSPLMYPYRLPLTPHPRVTSHFSFPPYLLFTVSACLTLPLLSGTLIATMKKRP